MEEKNRKLSRKLSEWNYLLRFARGADLEENICREQLQALWTAYCLHYNLDVDTRDYDIALSELWDLAEEGWKDFEEFDLFMGNLLT